MDKRKLNTEQILMSGILPIEPPLSKAPKDFVGQKVDEWEWTEESLKEGLETDGLTASMYYGCWDIWKTCNGYSGQLLQYRAITDEFQDQSIHFALEKAVEWAFGCQG